jgi:NAD(P)-dependent dehydrogenase (short-subunit alcohol dehydrogenase family)
MVGKVVVITGGTRGIGRGMAGAFLEHGCRVVFTGRSEDSVDFALAAAPYAGRSDEVLGCACDSADPVALQALWDRAVARFGRIDIWINNAAVMSPRRSFDAQTHETIDAVIRTNVIGAMLATHIALNGMLAQDGGGQIFNFEGFGSDGMVRPGMAIYGSSKAAMRYFARSMAKEYPQGPVRLGMISPGIVITDMITGERRQLSDEQWQRSKRMYQILGDRVETVAPWLARRVLASTRHGDRIVWLTPGKAFRRFAGRFILRRRRADVFATDGD